MSSSNLVSVRLIEESVYGETPAAGDFEEVRFTSEALSGTPETTESQQIRTDRLSSGQVVTGLTVGGDLNFELAKEDSIDLFLESAMLNSWVTSSAVSVDLEIDITAKTIERTSGDWNSDVAVGDLVKLTGFTNTVNNDQVMVTSIDSALIIKAAFPDTMIDEVGSGTSFQVADKLTIGTTKKSFSMEKVFTDLATKAIVYKGMTVASMNLSVNYGEIINGTFGFSGNYHDDVNASGDFITDGRTISPQATTESMNGSIDMPFVVSSATGVLDEATFCIQGVEMDINNNLTPQTCIGSPAPEDYSPGTAQVGVSLSSYLSDENWAVIAKKITQTPFSVGFSVKNAGGQYGFFLPAVQVSGDDPASGGQNQDVILSMDGVGKVGASGESSLVIYRA